jgi:hypothetical protein
MVDESGAWLTYQEVGERLGITPEAARSRAKRLGWRKQLGNDGQPLVWAAIEPRPPGDQLVTTRPSPGRKPYTRANAQLIEALWEHVQTLKEQLAAAEARLVTAHASLAAAEARAAQESAKAERAIAAFAAVAERTPWGEEPARPWWRRLARVGGPWRS